VSICFCLSMHDVVFLSQSIPHGRRQWLKKSHSCSNKRALSRNPISARSRTGEMEAKADQLDAFTPLLHLRPRDHFEPRPFLYMISEPLTIKTPPVRNDQNNAPSVGNSDRQTGRRVVLGRICSMYSVPWRQTVASLDLSDGPPTAHRALA